jgi:hypothetical protein
MSEYQYYEFLALDRPLTDKQRAELRSISTRAEITATRFVNEYQWGDLKGDPRKMMERYFDAFLYLANWGTRQLMFRLPRGVLDPETAGRYCSTDTASLIDTGGHLILSCYVDREPDDDWEEPGGQLAAMVQARAELAARHLDQLATRTEAAWEKAAELIETKRPRDYDLAASLLRDLQALAERQEDTAAFRKRFGELRTQHQRKPSLLDRFDQAGLPS